MTRRSFSWILSGAFFAPGPASHDLTVTFEATTAARLPHALRLPATREEARIIEQMRGHVWELRSYRLAGPSPDLGDRFAELFARAGIRPLFGIAGQASLTYLIPFENLAARDRAWTLLNVDQRWISARGGFRSYRFGLYRLA